MTDFWDREKREWLEHLWRDEYVTPKEIAELLGVTAYQVYYELQRGWDGTLDCNSRRSYSAAIAEAEAQRLRQKRQLAAQRKAEREERAARRAADPKPKLRDRRFRLSERREIEQLYRSYLSTKEIAEKMGCSNAVIIYELQRGANGTLDENGRPAYSAEIAQQVYEQRRRKRGGGE